MKKFGYSLAETLIALMIVGVVAALTIPGLVKSNENKSNAAALSVAVSDFENALANMMISDEVDKLTDTRFYKATTTVSEDNEESEEGNEESEEGNDSSANAAAKILGEYIEIQKSGTTPDKVVASTSLKGLDGSSESLFSDYTFVSKKGAVYNLYSGVDDKNDLTEADAISKGVSITSVAYELMIDVNGDKKPNTIGRDVFGFAVGNDGVLYPWGGRDYDAYSKTGYWNSNTGNFSCKDITKVSGWGCTARLIENNYKVDY